MPETRIALIGCSKTKSFCDDPSKHIEARNLYSSQLFSERVAYVESKSIPWYILSAKCGLLKPTTPVRYYNVSNNDLTELEIAEWHVGVASQLFSEVYYEFRSVSLKKITVELHAGKKYCEPLGAILSLLGITVEKPVQSLGIGQQLHFYKKLNSTKLV